MAWVSAPLLSELAGISEQRSRKLLSEFYAGRTRSWHGAVLKVHVAEGRGGLAGKIYRAKEDCLPPALQARLKALQKPLAIPSNSAPTEVRTRQHLWWVEFLRPIVAHPPGSPERAAELAALAGRPTFDWEGMPYTPRLRTLQRQAKRHDDNDTAAHRTRADKGAKRTFVSQKWDRSVPFDDTTKQRIADDLTQEIRGLVKGGASRGQVVMLAAGHLNTLTRAEGFRANDPAYLNTICAVPRQLVDAQWHYRVVHQFKRDRKAYEDAKPRIRRTIAGMRPMELVVADVHPVDVHLLRDDGSLATARFVAFMDVGTQRVRGRLVLLEKGGGIRNADVIEAFADMVGDPSWGMPETLYLDNGSEYRFADLFGDAMQLVVRGFHGPSRACRILRALPYNASAKQIERWFGDFEKRFLSTLPGWIGGDRMKKKQEAIGRTVAPFGTFEAFHPAFYGLLGAYHAIRQERTSALKGLSPNEAFAAHIRDGWAAIVMGRDEVRAACAKTEERQVKGGTISVQGQTWTCRELQGWSRDTVLVRVPAYHEPLELLLLKPDGEPLGIAQPERAFHPLDMAGALETGMRQGMRRQGLRALDRAAPTAPVAERLIALGNERSAPVPNAPAGTISHGPTSRAAVREKAQRDRERQQREADEIFEIQQALATRIAAR